MDEGLSLDGLYVVLKEGKGMGWGRVERVLV